MLPGLPSRPSLSVAGARCPSPAARVLPGLPSRPSLSVARPGYPTAGRWPVLPGLPSRPSLSVLSMSLARIVSGCVAGATVPALIERRREALIWHVSTRVLPGLPSRPSLSAAQLPAPQPIHTLVLPGLPSRPSLSDGSQIWSAHNERGVAGATVPALIERTRFCSWASPKSSVLPGLPSRPSLSEDRQSTVVGRCQPVLPGLPSRPSLSGRHGPAGGTWKAVLPGLPSRPSLSDLPIERMFVSGGC